MFKATNITGILVPCQEGGFLIHSLQEVKHIFVKVARRYVGDLIRRGPRVLKDQAATEFDVWVE